MTKETDRELAERVLRIRDYPPEKSACWMNDARELARRLKEADRKREDVPEDAEEACEDFLEQYEAIKRQGHGVNYKDEFGYPAPIEIWNAACQYMQQRPAVSSMTEGVFSQKLDEYRTVMMAAAVEITEHWEAHCDNDGYGPTNLIRNLENSTTGGGYGYTAKDWVDLQRRVQMVEEGRFVPITPTLEMIQAMASRQVEGEETVTPGTVFHALWVEVYAAMLAAAPSPPSTGWISVKDRLPDGEDAEGCLFVACHGSVYLGGFSAERKQFEWDMYSYGIDGAYEDATHWMPLPQPPEG